MLAGGIMEFIKVTEKELKNIIYLNPFYVEGFSAVEDGTIIITNGAKESLIVEEPIEEILAAINACTAKKLVGPAPLRLNKCKICKGEMRMIDDYGGDCIKCMADAGDPSAIAELEWRRRNSGL